MRCWLPSGKMLSDKSGHILHTLRLPTPVSVNTVCQAETIGGSAVEHGPNKQSEKQLNH